MKETNNRFRRLVQRIIPRRGHKDFEPIGKLTQIPQEQADQYPLDFEHSAIPPLSPNDQLYINAINSTLESMQLTSKDVISKDETLAEIGLFERAFRCPENTASILKKLGLNITKPMNIVYAMNYINAVGRIKWLTNSPEALADIPDEEREQRITNELEGFASLEKRSFTLNVLRLSREEMMQIRQGVEEAFRTHPEAYTTHL